jgi:hypothetical protein
MAKLKFGKYQHYKGKQYKILFIAINSDTLEDMVIYQGLYDDERFGKNPIWTRSLKSFLEDVVVDGKTVPRFQFLG